MMIKPHILSSLSARLSLWIVTIATILFVAVLWIMLWFAHRALEEEATQKALATLESASLTIDNELSKIETAVRNMRWAIEQHIDYPEAMMGLSRQMLETNPSIEGCNIAFRPDYYPSKGHYFMVYNQRLDHNIVGSDNYSNTKYDEQSWFANALKTGTAEWSDPSEVSQYINRAITSYNVPFYHPTDKEHKLPVGVISVDIALDRLSLTIQSTRPFPNTYCSVMNRQGSFIIHPDTTMLNPGSLKNQLEMYPSEEGQRLAEAMKNGVSFCGSGTRNTMYSTVRPGIRTGALTSFVPLTKSSSPIINCSGWSSLLPLLAFWCYCCSASSTLQGSCCPFIGLTSLLRNWQKVTSTWPLPTPPVRTRLVICSERSVPCNSLWLSI